MPREFIDREHQLGPDLGLTPADQLNTQDAVDSMQAAPRGDPPKSFDVRSVYDSRPVQGFDFNITDSTDPSEGGLLSIATLSFQVPQGYVCVLRGIHHSTNPPLAILGRSDITVSLLVNGSSVKYNQDIPVGTESDDIVRCFVIADEFSTVSAVFTNRVGNYPDQFTFVQSILSCQFYGQFLLKTGVSYKFEVANPSDKAWIKPSVQIPVPQATQPVPQQQPAQQVVVASQPLPAPVKPAIVHRAVMAAGLGATQIFDRRTGRIIGYR